MRWIILLACSLSITGWLVWAQEGAQERPHLLIEPFANTYEMQQETGVDFGFNEGERFPGFGGGADSISVTFRFNGVEISCDEAIVRVSAIRGLIRQGNIYCSIERDRIYVEDVYAAIDVMESAPSWRLHKNDLEPLPDGVPNQYEAIYHVYRHLLLTRFDQRIPVVRRDIMSWRSDENRGSIDINAAVNWRNDSSGKMRLHIQFLADNNCMSDISGYEGASEHGLLDQPEYQGISHLREYFSDRVYSEIPWEERVALTHLYVTEICENTSTW